MDNLIVDDGDSDGMVFDFGKPNEEIKQQCGLTKYWFKTLRMTIKTTKYESDTWQQKQTV